MPLIVFDPLIHSTIPETNVLMPRVTIRLSISSRTTIAPFTSPTATPASTAARIASPIGQPWFTFKIAISMADSNTTDATDRS